MFPEKAAVLGGTYKVPVYEKLLSKTFVNDLKQDGTFNEASFAREYQSTWGGDIENAFFSTEIFDKHRILLQAEDKFSGRSTKTAYYVIGVDVGRLGCTTEAVVIKVTPQAQGSSIKSIVNIYSLQAEHFEDQAIHLKRLFYAYKARILAIDANGLGVGLIDFMVKSQIDPNTGDTLPDFGVANDEEKMYRRFLTPDTEDNSMYLIKANAPLNTEAYSYVQTQMSSGKIKFLIDENQAKVKLMSSSVGRNMKPEERNARLRPYVLTTILREEMANLVEDNQGMNIILKQSTKAIKKDKFSALCYGLYYIKQEEETKKRRRGLGKQLMFFN